MRHPRCAALVFVTLLVILWPVAARAQAFTTVTGKEPIPREGYKSWSLFLVTNQSWLTRELSQPTPPIRAPVNADWVLDLYQRSRVFGRVIGKDHLAVWFWTKTAPLLGQASAAELVDVERAIAFCAKLKLKPSEGPYLIFTTTYPDENAPPSAFSVIKLGTSADRISTLLARLGDELVTQGMVRESTFTQPTNTDDFWRAWFEATRRSLANLGLTFAHLVLYSNLVARLGRTVADSPHGDAPPATAYSHLPRLSGRCHPGTAGGARSGAAARALAIDP